MYAFTLLFPGENPPDAGKCLTCGTDGNWEKGEMFMGKQLWFNTLSKKLCEKCLQQLKEADAEETARKQEERRKQRLARIFGGSRHVEEDTFEKLNPKLNPIFFRMMRDVNPLTENLFVHGKTGVGKTALSIAIARRALDQGRSVKVYRMMELNWDLREAEMAGELRGLIDRLTEIDVLVLDDLGIGKENEFRIEALCRIIENRQSIKKYGLIVTSNFDLDGIAEKMGDRIPSRLRGMCKEPHGKMIYADGPDIRLMAV